jgi:tetratricopeptide (TPR) repeat protein
MPTPIPFTHSIDEKSFGPEHPAVATDLNNLAEFYDTQDQYAKAEPLYQRALAIREKPAGGLFDVGGGLIKGQTEAIELARPHAAD